MQAYLRRIAWDRVREVRLVEEVRLVHLSLER